MSAERGHPPSRPQAGPPPARGGPRRVPDSAGTSVDPVASRGPRRLAKPKAVRVKADATGRPQIVGKREVDAVRESWLVEDRWWTEAPLRRRYWEVVTGDGRDLIVFRDLLEGRWYTQR